jgi:dephospho-CoA kinase
MLLNKTLIIVRGLPGAGKSTVAELLSDEFYPVISADDFFTLETGAYNFDVNKLHEAHAWCRDWVVKWMKENKEKIFVANTFTTESEVKSYYEIAREYDYNVISLIVENRHGGISIHNVPDDTLDKMKNRFSVKL